MKTLSVKLPSSLDARLTALARWTGATKSDLVRKALEDLLSRNGRRPAVSALDLARDLVGCAPGPRDLSYNPRHMRGFGR
jgi:Arc/MetJ-type ribon-helix-helix transcriptional regulator